jgi:hypothetical protein
MKPSKLSELKRQNPISALLILLILLLVVVEAAEVLLHPLRIPAEAALQIAGTQIALAGKIPYIDFSTDAAPLLFYFLSFPVVIAKLRNLHPIFVFNLFVLCLSWLSVLLIIKLLKNNKSNSKPALLLLYALLPIIFRFQFGQVEYIFLILFTPFVLARWLSLEGEPTGDLYAAIAGIAGGVAVNLSPVFILYPILLELFWICERRTHRYVISTELKTMLIVSVSYWLHLCVYPADILRSCLHCIQTSIVLQMTCHDGYLVWEGSSPNQRNSVYGFALLIIFGLIFRRNCSLVLPLILCDLAAFIQYVAKGRGTSTDLLLVNFSSLMLMPIIYFSLAKLFRLSSFSIGRRLLLLAGIVSSSCFLIYQFWSVRFEEFASLRTLGYRGYQNKMDLAPFADWLEKNSKVSDPVMILSNDVKPAFPLLLQLRRVPSGYYLTGFPVALLQLAHDERAPDGWWQKDMDSVDNRLACDLLSKKPVLVLMEDGPPWDSLEKSSFSRVLRERYHLGTSKSLWDVDSLAKASGYPIELIGERRNLDMYLKKDKKEAP